MESSFMKVRLALEFSALLMLTGFAAQAATSDRSLNLSDTCAPVAGPQASAGSNYEQTSSMTEMCTAADPWTADPWKGRTIGANTDQGRLVGPVEAKPRTETPDRK
jgi:hypothetical protein